MALQAFTTFRLPDGSVIEMVDWVDKPLFSTGELLTGFTDEKIDLFTYGVNEEVAATENATVRRTSTENDTNVATSGGMTSQEELLIYAIKPEFFELQTDDAGATDLTTAAPTLAGQPMMRPSVLKHLHMNVMLVLDIAEKTFAEAGLGYFNAGFDVFGMGATTQGALADANVRSYAAQGVPSAEGTRTFAIPQHIGGTEKYQLMLRNYEGEAITFQDEAATAIARLLVRTRIYLDGMRKRPTG